MGSHSPGRFVFAIFFLSASLTLWTLPVQAESAVMANPTTHSADLPKPASSETAKSASSAVEASVVKVFSTMRYPDLYRPWTKQAPSDATGSGVVIEGKRVLTNAHVVLYASQVQIQANQAGDKVSATVEAVAPGIDLALLKLDDESFFDTHQPLPRAKMLPKIKDAVLTYGFPTGGTNLSITKGIVSRIDFTSYNGNTSGLRIQVDAAVNPGNSGGPAVAGDKMIGLAFSHLRGTENIGYIIPCEEIELFLADIADGHYDGKPSLYDQLQTLEDPALRKFLKLGKNVEGIIVHSVDDPARSPLKEWDVITKIGDSPVDDQGMSKLDDNLRISFRYWVQKIAKNGKVPLTIVRSGIESTVEVPVSPDYPLLIPELSGGYPNYFVYGPLVFSDATADYVRGFSRGERGAGIVTMLSYVGSPLITRSGEKPAFEGERLVVVSSPFFPHKLCKGYSNPVAQALKKVNDIPIRNLAQLVQVLRDCKDEFIRIEFSMRGGETLIFSRAEMLAQTDEILTDNGVRSQGSPDVLKVWAAKN